MNTNKKKRTVEEENGTSNQAVANDEIINDSSAGDLMFSILHLLESAKTRVCDAVLVDGLQLKPSSVVILHRDTEDRLLCGEIVMLLVYNISVYAVCNVKETLSAHDVGLLEISDAECDELKFHSFLCYYIKLFTSLFWFRNSIASFLSAHSVLVQEFNCIILTCTVICLNSLGTFV